METILLSIGIIFKNDIRCMERCLQSLEPLRRAIPCQLVMADTGSTDGSRAVAERYADILIDFPWVNDFAAARNAVLDRCVGKWCLTVDTDEWLIGDFSQLVQFLRSQQADCQDVARIVVRNPSGPGSPDYADYFATRMGRRRGGKLRYVGAIHEYLIYTDSPLLRAITLPKVIFNHDGYLEMTPGALAAKHKRNMELLRKELAKDPDNLRILKQSIDSAESTEERRSLVERSRAAVAKQTDRLVDGEIYAVCAQFYWDQGELIAARQCLEDWRTHLSNSALYHVDGEYLQASVAYQQDRYQDALEHIRAYEAGVADVDSGADLHYADRVNSMYYYATVTPRQQMQCTRFHCLCVLERFEEADALLKEPALLDFADNRKGFLVLKVLEFWDRLRQAVPFLRSVWDRAAADLAGADGKPFDACKKWADDLANMFQLHYEQQGWPVLERFLEMGDRAPGRSARILLSDDPAAIAREWEAVTQWPWMFPEAYLHTMELGVPLPAGFYRQTSEEMARLATSLAQKPALPRVALDWLTHSAPAETPGELTWQLDLITAALRAWDWKQDAPVGEDLCALYTELSATYLDNLYNPELLNEEDIQVLPGMQRFAWYLRQAYAAWEQGDELGYVRFLKAGLDAAPAMKDMVDFLLQHKPKTAA